MTFPQVGCVRNPCPRQRHAVGHPSTVRPGTAVVDVVVLVLVQVDQLVHPGQVPAPRLTVRGRRSRPVPVRCIRLLACPAGSGLG